MGKKSEQTRSERSAAMMAAQAKAEKRRQLLVAGSIGAVLLLLVGLFVLWQSLRDQTAEKANAAPANATSSYGLKLGSDTATHEVVIYEDFLCPACAAAEQSLNETFAKAIEAGTVSVEYRPFELLGRLGDYSLRSANAWAVVLDQHGPEVAKKFHDSLYAEQPPETSPFPDDAWLIQKAVAAGADEAKIKQGIADLKFEGWVKNATDHASKDKVTSTPTIRVDGKDMTGKDMNELIANVTKAIEAK